MVTAALLAGTMLLTSCGAGKTAIKAGNVKVTEGDIMLMTEAYYTQFGNYATAKSTAVKNLEDGAITYAVAQKMGIELTEDDEAKLRQAKANFTRTFGSVTEYKEKAKEVGGNDEMMEISIVKPLYEEKILEGTEYAEATEEDGKQFFVENYMRATHVLISTDEGQAEDEAKKKAEDILARAKNGEDFDQLVAEFSEDPGSATNPNGYVFYDGEMVPEFENAVKSINPGEYIMCKSDFGYHVIKRLPLDESDEHFEEFWTEKQADALLYAAAEISRKGVRAIAEQEGIVITKDQDVIDNIQFETE